MSFFIVDRIENGLAVLECENKTFIQVPISDFSSPIGEGSVVVRNSDGKFCTDTVKTAERKAKLFALQKNIFSD